MKNTKIFKSIVWCVMGVGICFLYACSGGNSGNTSGEWKMQYYPPVGNSSATLTAYSTKTGSYENFYVNEGNWVKNESLPQPNVTIQKGNLRMDYIPATATALPGLSVYCATTGQYEQFYLEEGEWKKNPYIPQPDITVAKGDLKIEYNPATSLSSETLNVYSNTSREYEQFYRDGEVWKRNPNFPAANKI